MKLNFGSGTKYVEGWLNVDGGEHLKPQGYKIDKMFRFDEFPYPLENDSFDEILAMHVLEHISWRKQESVLKELFRVAKNGCELTVRVPALEALIKWVRNGKCNSGDLWYNSHLKREQSLEERFLSMLLGGQAHDEDFHIGTLWKERLERIMISSGWKIKHSQVCDEELYVVGVKE